MIVVQGFRIRVCVAIAVLVISGDMCASNEDVLGQAAKLFGAPSARLEMRLDHIHMKRKDIKTVPLTSRNYQPLLESLKAAKKDYNALQSDIYSFAKDNGMKARELAKLHKMPQFKTQIIRSLHACTRLSNQLNNLENTSSNELNIQANTKVKNLNVRFNRIASIREITLDDNGRDNCVDYPLIAFSK